jgi:quercetin dioxygenase-like cupin family protein
MRRISFLGFVVLLFASRATVAQVVPGRCETPVTERTSQFGCYLVSTLELGKLSATDVYWHLYTYPTLSEASARKGAQSIVAQSLGKVWTYTIAGKDWRPKAGKRVALVGPLPHDAQTTYTARYMEAVFEPGARTPVHTHSGPEAWYVLAGEQCLETPEGITVVRAGEAALVRQGPPMVLSSVGSQVRRSVLLVLHARSERWIAPYANWKAKGLCPK